MDDSKKQNNEKENNSIKLDEKTLEDNNVNLFSDDDYDGEEENKVKDFYDFDESLFDFAPVGSVGNKDFLNDIKPNKPSRLSKNEKIKNPLKDNKNLDVNLFDDDKQKLYEMFNKDENVMFNSNSNDKKREQDELQKQKSSALQENDDNEEVLIKDNNANNEINFDEAHLKSLIESAMYVYGGEGLSINDMKKLTGAPSALIRKIMKNWINELENNQSRGLTIKVYGERYKLFSKAENREDLSKLITIKYRDPLSQRVVETLAIIAYNQPCTKAIIEEIRGKDPTSAIQKLIDLGLVAEAGRADHPGRPLLFEVTHKFYDIFGIKNVKDLPVINLDQPFQDDDVSFFDTTRFNE